MIPLVINLRQITDVPDIPVPVDLLRSLMRAPSVVGAEH